MRIGFDARMITHPGIGRYIKCILPELIKKANGEEFVIFGDPEKLSHLSKFKNVTIKIWTAPIYSVLEQLTAPLVLRNIDVLHVPHFNIPLFYTGKIVVTIHDLIYLLFPESVPNPLAKYYAKFIIKAALNKASKVITVSAHTRNDLVKIFGEKYFDKIKIIYEAPGDIFQRVTDKAKLAHVKLRYRLSDNFILYVGSIKPHKNIISLIEMFALLKAWGLPHQLVICGRWDKRVNHLKEKLDDRNIRYLGEIPTEDLISLYSMADILVHLSFYEGFGLTVLEAMQCGTPVVISDSSSLPEIAGKSAFVVPPDNVEHIADTVFNVLVNKQLKTGMSETGIEHVKQFSWKKAAIDTMDIYRGL